MSRDQLEWNSALNLPVRFCEMFIGELFLMTISQAPLLGENTTLMVKLYVIKNVNICIISYQVQLN